MTENILIEFSSDVKEVPVIEDLPALDAIVTLPRIPTQVNLVLLNQH